MNFLVNDQTWQLISWSLGLIQLILCMYILALNPGHAANRHASFLFLVLSLNSFAIGWLIGATTAAEAYFAAAILAATTLISAPALLITATVLVKPAWFTGKLRFVRLFQYFLVILPIALILLDVFFDTRIWFTGFDPNTYTGGFAGLAEYTNPEMGLFRSFYMIGIPLLTLIPLSYLSFFDSRLSAARRRLARLLLVGQLGIVILEFFAVRLFPQPIPTILGTTLFFIIYAYASFSQLISERQYKGQLQVRLTVLTLIVTLPLLVFSVVYLGNLASSRLRQQSVAQLGLIGRSVGATVETRLEFNIKALQQMVLQPGIISMNANFQKPILQTLIETYPQMYLVSTTDQNGMNIARSDTAELTDYSDRSWYQAVMQGAGVGFQTLIGRTSNVPALVVSIPILAPNGEISGVGMFASTLTDIAEGLDLKQVDDSITMFVVDPDDKVVTHTHAEYMEELADFSNHPAVLVMRDRESGYIRYQDEAENWRIAFFQEINYDWGVVVEQSQSDLLAGLSTLRSTIVVVIVIGILLVGSLTSLTIRQAISPIKSLTETATAIASGDLSRVAPVESEDEFGLLASTFNRMTEQLLELIGNLEQRVSERTKALENRSKQLEATAEVSRNVSTILDEDTLINDSVELILQNFDLYYVGLFLIDENREYAVLRAGTGEAGQAMLARQHKIPLGQGMIGWAIANNQARVAMEAQSDLVRRTTSELPETRSEAALPLRARGDVIGAISVQSARAGAFDSSTMATLQTMADLVSIAIDNARLFTATENALQASRRVYGELSQTGWKNLFQSKSEIIYRSDGRTTAPVAEYWSPEMEQAWVGNRTIHAKPRGEEPLQADKLAIPIRVRGNVIGVLQTHKSDPSGVWSEEEQSLLETIIEQLGLALEGARLYDESQQRANQERLIVDITSRMREHLVIDTILKTTLREMGEKLSLSEVEVRLVGEEKDNTLPATEKAPQVEGE